MEKLFPQEDSPVLEQVAQTQSPPFEGRSYHTYSFTHGEGGNEYINRIG